MTDSVEVELIGGPRDGERVLVCTPLPEALSLQVFDHIGLCEGCGEVHPQFGQVTYRRASAPVAFAAMTYVYDQLRLGDSSAADGGH